MKFKFLDILIGIFVAIMLISNVISVKIFKVGPLSFDGGTILFPLAYIFGDIFTEVYGYKNSRRIIWTGFFANILMAVSFMIVGRVPAATGWQNQEAYNVILGWVPRIVIASICAYWVGSFANSFVLAKIKILTKGKKLWVRTIGSTIIGELLDTVLFCVIAFYGQLPPKLLLAVIISNYLLKVGIEIFFTPITYKVVKLLKKYEAVDIYDYHTRFTPFSLDNSSEIDKT